FPIPCRRAHRTWASEPAPPPIPVWAGAARQRAVRDTSALRPASPGIPFCPRPRGHRFRAAAFFALQQSFRPEVRPARTSDAPHKQGDVARTESALQCSGALSAQIFEDVWPKVPFGEPTRATRVRPRTRPRFHSNHGRYGIRRFAYGTSEETAARRVRGVLNLHPQR